jgi:hypothetical protein
LLVLAEQEAAKLEALENGEVDVERLKERLTNLVPMLPEDERRDVIEMSVVGAITRAAHHVAYHPRRRSKVR